MGKLRPLHDRILIKRDEAATKSPGGILLPEQARDKPQSGKVLAIGDGCWDRDGESRVPMDVKPGDKVWFTTYAGSEVEVDKEKFIVMREADILAVES